MCEISNECNDSNLQFIDFVSVNEKALDEKNTMTAYVTVTLPIADQQLGFKIHGFSHC